MIPAQWNETICDLLDGTKFPEQERYARQLFPQVVQRLRTPASSNPEVRLLYQSFSYAHQRFGDLTGRMNLVCSEHSVKSFVALLSAYLSYIERQVLVVDASTLAAEESASWDNKGFEVTDTRLPYLILTNADFAFREYRLVAALQSAVLRQNAAISATLFISTRALDTIPPAVSADASKVKSYQNFDLEVLDVPGIILEKKKERA